MSQLLHTFVYDVLLNWAIILLVFWQWYVPINSYICVWRIIKLSNYTFCFLAMILWHIIKLSNLFFCNDMSQLLHTFANDVLLNWAIILFSFFGYDMFQLLHIFLYDVLLNWVFWQWYYYVLSNGAIILFFAMICPNNFIHLCMTYY